jgi:hypothetical protein
VNDLRAAALAVLERNARDGYTVPAEGLYPYQWCWDSGPIALGWAAAGRWDRAWTELRTLLSAQWESGFVPHIVFWQPCDDYFPGPEVWSTGHAPATTGLTQPPLPASAAARLFVDDPDRARARAQMSELGPRLVAWVEWLARARRGPHGACVVVHPWESGMDNAPCWDEPLSRVPSADDVHLARRDVATVASELRPTDRDYRHYLGIVEVLRDAGWDTERQVDASPFAVEDPGFTAIAIRGAVELARVGPEIGVDVSALEEFVSVAGAGLAALWDDEREWFCPYDERAARSLAPRTAGGLVALWSGVVPSPRIERMLARVEEWRQAALAVPTCEPTAAQFDPERYWRGPVWVLVNWLVAQGLLLAGDAARAESLRRSTLALVERSGFTEYYDALTGAGIGGHGFSWSAALTLAWLTASTS